MKNIFKKLVVKILTWEAKQILHKYNPKIVGVTGSVGKTSTKDAIFTVLSAKYHVRKSEKSFNSEFGVPLTIIGSESGWNNPVKWFQIFIKGFWLILYKTTYPEWLVLEVGADRPGDIKTLAEWLKPDIAVVTKLAKVPVHVEYFKSPAEVIKEKAYLAKAVRQGGTLILNTDDEDVLSFKELAKGAVLTFGVHEEADLSASHISVMYEKDEPMGMTFRIDHKGSSVPVVIKGALGLQLVYPAIAALGVGATEEISLVDGAQALEAHEPPKGRMRIVPGIKKTTILDDTYNSSPVALTEALRALNNLKSKGRKIAVLGDMMELGKYSSDEHKKAGEAAAQVVDMLVTVGVRARYMAEGALLGGLSEKNVLQFENSREAGAYIQNLIKEGDLILIKGSQSIRMERTVEEIMADPEHKADVLVRQDEEWLRR